MAATKVLWCTLRYPQSFQRMTSHFEDVSIVRCGPDEVMQHMGDVEVVVPYSARMTAEVMDAAPNLKLIQQTGVGLETVDVEAASARGIPVAHVPSVVSRSDASVAEVALLHILVLVRRYQEAAACLRSGAWGQPVTTVLVDKTAGIIGLGGIGRAVARRLKAFEMRLLAVDVPEVARNEEYRLQTGVDWLGEVSQLDYLLAESDFVVLCTSLNPSSRGMIGWEQLAKMKPSAFLINVARGGLVDQVALEKALREGVIAGAGLDVFAEEPLDPNSGLLQCNVSATPHIGAPTDFVFDRAGRTVAENIRRLRTGEPLLNCVNASDLVGRARVPPEPPGQEAGRLGSHETYGVSETP